MTISAQQMAAARSGLSWGQKDLAKKANLSLSTIRDFERGRRTPHANNIIAIRSALEAAGITFTESEEIGPGVSFKPEDS